MSVSQECRLRLRCRAARVEHDRDVMLVASQRLERVIIGQRSKPFVHRHGWRGHAAAGPSVGDHDGVRMAADQCIQPVILEAIVDRHVRDVSSTGGESQDGKQRVVLPGVDDRRARERRRPAPREVSESCSGDRLQIGTEQHSIGEA